jgi:hypothetical protein
MALPALRRVKEQQHATLVARDAKFLRSLSGSYADVAQEIGSRLENLRAKAAEAGADAKPSWLYEGRRLHILGEQVQGLLDDFSDDAADDITGEMSDAAGWGADDAVALLDVSAGSVDVSFAKLPKGAIASIVDRATNARGHSRRRWGGCRATGPRRRPTYWCGPWRWARGRKQPPTSSVRRWAATWASISRLRAPRSSARTGMPTRRPTRPTTTC